jgi:hypothetical protein
LTIHPYRANALIEIAKAQPTAENFASAIETARQIDDSSRPGKCAHRDSQSTANSRKLRICHRDGTAD